MIATDNLFYESNERNNQPKEFHKRFYQQCEIFQCATLFFIYEIFTTLYHTQFVRSVSLSYIGVGCQCISWFSILVRVHFIFLPRFNIIILFLFFCEERRRKWTIEWNKADKSVEKSPSTKSVT